jgi:hypothetical protein
MKRSDHVQRQPPKPRIGVGAERIGTASQEWENGDGVPVIKAAQQLAIARCDGCHHEPQAHLVTERGGRAQGTPQSLEHGPPGVAQPFLGVQIVDRDEMGRAIVAGQLPVVAAPALRHVLHRRSTKAPALRERLSQALRHQVHRRAAHASRT